MNAFIVLVTLFGAVFVGAQHLTGNVDDYAACIDRWLAAKPDMNLRFDRQQIAWLCERTEMWQRRAQSKPDTNNDDILTNSQRKWLFNLRTCQGRDCIKNVIDQRCTGRRCRWPHHRVVVNPPTSQSELNITQDESVESDQVDQDFSTIDVDSPNFEPAVLITSDDQEGPDAQTVEGANGEMCQFKTKIARLCPAVLNGTTVESALPKKIASLRSTFTDASLDDQLRLLQEQFARMSAKCETVQTNLVQKGRTFDFFVSECSEKNIGATRSRMAAECIRVLEAKTADEALPELSRHLQGRTEDSHLRSRFQRFIAQKYEKWMNRCLNVQDALAVQGTSFNSWLDNLDQLRKKRQTAVTQPHQGNNGDMDLDDADFRAQRKEIRQMSESERGKFFAAVNRLKSEKIDGISMYDLLVIYHTPEESPGAHWGPAFLPFHREWIKQLEIALRQLDPDVAIPYWDSTLDEGLPTPKDSILWTDNFFGNGNGNVISGPFANWVATHELGFVPNVKTLYRDVGTSPFGGLFKESDITFAMNRYSYQDFTACVDPTFELVHGVVHMFVGGYMADIAISPNDPTFFMHHCFIDYMWEDWRQAKQTLEAREKDYPTDDRSCNDFHYGSHQMQPFAIKNIDGLSNNYTRDFYFYNPRPRCSNIVPDCGSPYIFCDTKKYRCLSKIQSGGNCTGFDGTSICLGGICSGGKCIAQQGVETTTLPPTTATTTATTTSTTVVPITLPPSTITIPITTTATSTLPPTPETTTTVINHPPTPNPDELTTPSPPRDITTTLHTTSTTPLIITESSPTTPLPTPDTPATTMMASTPTDPPTTSYVEITTLPSTTTDTVTTQLFTPTPTTVVSTSPPTSTPVAVTTPTMPGGTTTLRTPIPVSTPPPTPVSINTTPRPTPTLNTPASEEHNNPPQQGGSVIGWEEQPPFPVVYFTISVVQGDFQGIRQESRRAAPNCQIILTGLNVPSGYTQSMRGMQYTTPAFPQYSSGAVVRAMDPSKAGYFPLVEVDVSVFNVNGARCSRFCYDGKQYNACDDKIVKLSANSAYSDPIVFRNTFELAQTVNWSGRGYYRTRKEDYLLFQCPQVYG